MHVIYMDYCLYFMHGLCLFRAWNLAHFMHIPYVVLVYSMHGMVWYGIGEFHVWYRRIPCMYGAGVFHVWYRHIPCMVQEYFRYRCVFTVHGAGIPMHVQYRHIPSI